MISKEHTESLILIGGGVGPMAGVKAAEELVINTNACSDQDHPEWCLVNANVSDRTQYLLNKEYKLKHESPAICMAKSIRSSVVGAIQNKIITGVPCNTFHVFAEEYENELAKISAEAGKSIIFVNMITETIKMIQQIIPNVGIIGIISISGMRASRIYDHHLDTMNIDVLHISEDEQAEFDDTVYNENWGIKSVKHDAFRTKLNMQRYAENLYKQGAEALILGCTEIPLVLGEKYYKNIPLINPVTALVRGLLMHAGGVSALRPLDINLTNN